MVVITFLNGASSLLLLTIESLAQQNNNNNNNNNSLKFQLCCSNDQANNNNATFCFDSNENVSTKSYFTGNDSTKNDRHSMLSCRQGFIYF